MVGHQVPGSDGVCEYFWGHSFTRRDINWLVVSTHLKNISQMANLPQIMVKKKIETTA